MTSSVRVYAGTLVLSLGLGLSATHPLLAETVAETPPAAAPAKPASPPGHAMRTAGIIVTSVAGGIGLGTVAVGAGWDLCIGATGDDRTKCRRHAQSVITAGAVITAASAAIGVPLIVIGQGKYTQWQKEQPVSVAMPTMIWSQARVAYMLPGIMTTF